jgi:hypothetical protein
MLDNLLIVLIYMMPFLLLLCIGAFIDEVILGNK